MVLITDVCCIKLSHFPRQLHFPKPRPTIHKTLENIFKSGNTKK